MCWYRSSEETSVTVKAMVGIKDPGSLLGWPCKPAFCLKVGMPHSHSLSILCEALGIFVFKCASGCREPTVENGCV